MSLRKIDYNSKNALSEGFPERSVRDKVRQYFKFYQHHFIK